MEQNLNGGFFKKKTKEKVVQIINKTFFPTLKVNYRKMN